MAQAQTGSAGFEVSAFDDGQIDSPPIDSGNRQPQQMSVIGLTKCPVQTPGAAWTGRARPNPATSASTIDTRAMARDKGERRVTAAAARTGWAAAAHTL